MKFFKFGSKKKNSADNADINNDEITPDENVAGNATTDNIDNQPIISENADAAAPISEPSEDIATEESESENSEDNGDANDKKKYKRHKSEKHMVKWHFFQALGSANAAIMMLLILLVGTIAIVRFGISSDFGRQKIEQSLNGLSLGPIGKLYVKGLEGDAFTDLKLQYAAIKDEKGIWIDGQNLKVKWDAIDLARRLVHLNDVKAGKINVYRRPIMAESKGKSGKDLPIAIQIDKLGAYVETHEAFSVKHGKWGVGLNMKIKRNKDINLKTQIINAERKTDYMKVDFATHKSMPIHSDIIVTEANGGPLAGMLGLNANLPLSINAQIQGGKTQGVINLNGLNGNNQFANVKGGWGADSGNFDGSINFAASNLTKIVAEKFGGTVNLDARWHKGEASKKNGHFLQIGLNGPVTDIKVSGEIDYKNRKTLGPLNVNLNTQQLRNMLHTMFLNAGAANLNAKLDGSIDKWHLYGPVAARDYALMDVNYALVNGELDIKGNKKGGLDVGVNFDANNNRGQGILSKLAGNKLKGNVVVKRVEKGHVFVDELNLNGANMVVTSRGGLSLFGNSSNLNGKAVIDIPILTGNTLSGKLNGNFSVNIPHDGGHTTIKVDAVGNNIHSQTDLINKVLGKSPKATATLTVNEKAYFTSLNIKTPDIEVNSTTFDKNELLGLIGGDVKIGNDTLKLFGLNGRFNGKFALGGLHRLNGPNDFASLDLNLVGDGFKTPVDLANQYITPKPTLRGKVLIGLKRVLVSGITLSSPDVTASADGQIVGPNDLALATKWTINKPIAIGPLEISSGLSGNGSIAGPYSGFNAKFTAIMNQLEIGGAIVSPANLTAQFKTGQSPMSVKLNFDGKSEFGNVVGSADLVNNKQGTIIRNIDISGAGIRATGGATLTANFNPAANFSVSINKGLLLENGSLNGRVRIEQSGKQTLANVDFSGQRVIFRGSNILLSSVQVKGAGSLDNLTLDTSFSAQAVQPVSFTGKTNINSSNGRTIIRINGNGKIDGRSFSITEPVELMFAKNHKKANGKISLSGNNAGTSTIEFDGEQNGENLRLVANADALSLSSLNQDFVGTFTGELRARNHNNNIVGELDGKLQNARARGLKANMAINGDIRALLNNEIITIKTNLTNNSGFEMVGDLTLPALTSVSPMRFAIERTKPIKGDVQINGEINPLADLVFAGQRYLSGQMVANSTISGTINDPSFNGNFALNNGKYREPDIGLTLIDLNITGTVTPEKVDIQKFSARDNKRGEVQGVGQLGLRGDSGATFNITTHKFRLIDNDIAQVDATGTVSLQHLVDKKSRLSGKLRIDQAEISPRSLSGTRVTNIDVKEINVPEELQQASFANGRTTTKKTTNAQMQRDIALDVNLYAERGIFVRGRGLNLELSLDSNIRGSLNKPDISGMAKVFRGEYEYGGRVFEFDDRGTVTLDEKPENIRLNLSASRETETLKAYINVEGNAAKPKISLTSTPSLPADEVLAQVLFGRSKSQLSPFEAVQLASSLAALAAGGGFDVMANLREFARLDRLVIGNNSSGEFTFAGGKYLGRDLYLEIISQGTEGVDTKVEWRPVRSTAIVSTVNSNGGARISVRWRRDIK